MNKSAMEPMIHSQNAYPIVTQELLDEIVDRIQSVGNPVKIVLFGSRARGNFKPDSDIDIMIVEESDENIENKKRQYNHALNHVFPELTLLVFPWRQVEEWKYVPGYIATVALAQGKILYENAERMRRLSLLAGGSHLVAEEVEYKTPGDLAFEWFCKAEQSLVLVEIGIEKACSYDIICFLAQQAAEMYLKGFLAFNRQEIGKTHDLNQLLIACRNLDALPELDEFDLDKMSKYAIGGRYGLDFHPSHQTAVETLEIVLRIRDIVLSRLPPEMQPGQNS